MVNSMKAASCLLSFLSNPNLSPEVIVEKVKGILKGKLDLEVIASIPLNEGSLVIFSAPKDGCNPTLTATLKMYTNQSLVTLDLEGAAPINASAVDGSYNFVAGSDLKAINNNSMDRLRDQLSRELGVDAEKIPVIKRLPDVPVYFTSSDDRVFEYDFDKTLFHKQSEHQKVCIYHSPTLGNALFLDDLINLAEADLSYTRGLMKFECNDYKGKEILILGGGDGGLLHELVKQEPAFVTMVDIDPVVMESCKEHLRGACGSTLDSFETDMYRVIVGDCIHFLEESAQTGRKFDAVFNDLTDIPLSDQEDEVGRRLWDFVRKILTLSLKCLKEDGKYLNHATGTGSVAALAAYEEELKRLPEKVMFTRHSAWVPSFLEDWVFYEIQKA